MAKLQTPQTAGFNAGGSYNVRYIQIKDIVINPEIANIFEIEKRVLEGLIQSMKAFGYNKEEPVAIWIDEKGNYVLVDGRTRYTAAKEAGLSEIPYIVKEFGSFDEVVFYTLGRQVLRRSLTNNEMILAIQLKIKGRKKNDGTGRNMDILADTLGVSAATLFQVKNVIENAPPEILESFQKGEMSAKKADQETRRLQRPEKEPPKPKTDPKCSDVPKHNKEALLRSSVVLLVEADQIAAAELLLNHFFRKDERRGFLNLLPEVISAQLSELISRPPVD